MDSEKKFGTEEFGGKVGGRLDFDARKRKQLGSLSDKILMGVVG